MSWLVPKNITRAGATAEQLLEAVKAGARAFAAEFLRKTDTPSGQLASADEPNDSQEQVA